MTRTAPTTQAAVRPAQLRPFPAAVRTVLASAINDHGVAYRLLDGGHIRLYSGDRTVPPIKVSAARSAEDSVRFLERWLELNVPSWGAPDVADLVAENAPTILRAIHDLPPDTEVDLELTIDKSGSALGLEPRVSEVKIVPKPTPASVMAVHSSATRAAEIKDEHVVPPTGGGTWPASVGPEGRSYGFETDGTTFYCTQCDYTQTEARGLHLHHRSHTDPAAAAEAARKAATSRAANREAAELRAAQELARVTAAAAALADHFGVGGEHLTAEVEELRAENTRLRQELDDARAKLEMIKEATGL